MDTKQIFCSLPDHSKEEANFFCPECKMHMCNSCNTMHSNFFKSLHHPYKLEKENSDNFSTGLCQVKDHFQELTYFCKTHNVLCCALCIVKIKDEINGKHSDCDIYKINEIEEEQKIKLKENIKTLENISKYINNSINKLKQELKKNKDNKDNLKLEIQKIFTKIRNQINERENILLSEIDQNLDDSSIKKDIINKLEKFPKKIESSLNQGKLIENQWKEKRLNISITQCLNIEKKLEEINSYKDIIKKNNENNLVMKFKPELNDINSFLNTIQEFGCIYNITDLQAKFDDIEDIENFLLTINQDMEEIYNTYIKEKRQFEPIIVKSNIKLIKKEKNKEIDIILNLFKSLLDFSKEKKVILVFFNSKFWVNLYNYYNEPKLDCIYFCYQLRIIFILYYNLINELFIDDKKAEYKNDINELYKKDEFTSYLDKNIKNILESNKYSDSEKIAILIQYNPYYNINDKNENEKYKDKRDLNILDYLLFENENYSHDFISSLKSAKFEIIFEKNIIQYLRKIISKIKNFSTFGLILDIIDINKIENKINEYFELLQEKYESVLTKEIEELNDNELKKGIKIIIKYFAKFYNDEKLYIIIDQNIKKLTIKNLILIYKDLIINDEEKYPEKLKKFIYQEILQNLKNNVNNIYLINSLEKDKDKFIIKIIRSCKFTKEEFFSKEKNENIEIICKINEDEKLNDKELKELIKEIFDDLDGKIKRKNLESFLSIEEEEIIKRLGLIKIIYLNYDPMFQYQKLKKIIFEINENIKELTFIKNSLLIYHFDYYIKEIKAITSIINDLQNNSIINNKSQRMKRDIEKFKELKALCDEIEKVKELLLFKVIYDNTFEKEQNLRFDYSIKQLNEIGRAFKKNVSIEKIYSKNKEIFDDLKNLIGTNEEKAKFVLNQIIGFFNIKDKSLINDLIILFYCKKYENVVKSIYYFFNCLFDNNIIKNNLENNYENLSNQEIEKIKYDLNILKRNEIYDYQSNNYYYNFFTCLYQAKEAIDYLLLKIDKEDEIKFLYDNLNPINGMITLENIQNLEECIKIFRQIKSLNDVYKIINFIKILDLKHIEGFVTYSNNYSLIKEYETYIYFSDNAFEHINNIIIDANLTFKIDKEDFTYGKNKAKLSLNELISLKNKIPIFNNIQKEEKEQKLIFFKNIINNCEDIYTFTKALREKGYSLPLLINIQINYPEEIYLINDNEKTFSDINEFLINVLSDYNNQLDSFYLQNDYIRFLFGNLFTKIYMHLNNKDNSIEDILRFILNEDDNNKKIKDGNIPKEKEDDDYLENYSTITQNSFLNIANYISSLFKNNNTSLQKNYEKMILIDKNSFKGIYLNVCENEIIEESLLHLFKEKIGFFPTVQNILFCDKETSFEEIKAFCYRAILCEYNALFSILIYNSFSESQKNVMFNCINKLLDYQNKKYNELNKISVAKEKTKDYLKSCIVFLCEENNKNILSFLYKNNNNKNKISINKKTELNDALHNNFNNVKIFTSDISGLGKTHRIKKIIEQNKKKYYHFSIGGHLSKNIIYQKLKSLIHLIKNENKESYENIAIHLDLIESEEIYLINEFLFSFLITKFYCTNQDILFIPYNKDIDIYIEIQNCFTNNYLSKFGILKSFEIINITVDNIPLLDLPKDIIDNFKSKFGLDTNQEIEKFIKNYICIEKYSYYQINIFINLFLSQVDLFSGKVKFLNQGKDETVKYIEDLARGTQYFIKGCSSHLLINKNNNTKNFLNYLSDIYSNDWDIMNWDIPLIFIVKKRFKFIPLKLEKNNSKVNLKTKRDYLSTIKSMLNLENELDKDKEDKKSLLYILDYKIENFIMTNDIYNKMILLLYRIKSNIPFIIMGETGCGKTLLIEKLNQIINNGEILLEKIDINPDITEEIIYEKMKRINQTYKSRKEEIWVFLDNINTCKNLELITEIFNYRSFLGEKLIDNIRLMAACNPYRKKINELNNNLAYNVNPLPQSLLYITFSFGSIKEEDENDYIFYMIEKLFKKNKEEKLHEFTKNAIFICHKFLKSLYDYSIVSLRDIDRFIKLVEFFQKYYAIKEEFNNEFIKDKEKLYKIKSIICSIYICYYFRLNSLNRSRLESLLRETLLKLVNYDENDNSSEEKEYSYLIEEINYQELKNDLIDKSVRYFSDIIKLEEEFLINNIEMNGNIFKNSSLKENVFLLFISIVTNIPLTIIGQSGKSLSIELIIKSMKGKYSKTNFFKKFPAVIPTYFQNSEYINNEDIKNVFQIAEGKYKFYSDKKCINKNESLLSLIIFDNIGIKHELNYETKNVNYIRISNDINDIFNYSELNKGLALLVQNIVDKYDDAIDTCKHIADNIKKDLSKNEIFDIIPRTYITYMNTLKLIQDLEVCKKLISETDENTDFKKKEFSVLKNSEKFIEIKLSKKIKLIKTDFHGYRDLLSLIEGISKEFAKIYNMSQKEEVIMNIVDEYIERNFGGIDYEFDIDLELTFDDIYNEFNLIREILNEFTNRKNEKIIINSAVLFKKLYNVKAYEKFKSNKYKIINNNRYSISQSLYNSINDINNRHLLLEIKPSLSSLISEYIKIQNPDKKIILYEQTSFNNNINNIEFLIHQIKEDAKNDNIVIIQNINCLKSFLYNFCDMNYIIKEGKKYLRIINKNNFRDELIFVNDLFKIIIFIDEKTLDTIDNSFLSRFEKIKLSFDKLMNREIELLTNKIFDETNLEHYININQNNTINYNLKNLLINYGKEEISGLIYSLTSLKNNENYISEDEIKMKVYYKLTKLLCFDIINCLSNNHIIKKIYENEEHYDSLEKYLKDEQNRNYYISIIYTFSGISENIECINDSIQLLISDFKTENEFKYRMDNIIKKQKGSNIIIHFEQNNSNKIQFCVDFINKLYKKEKNKFIFIIHIINKNENIYSIVVLRDDINQLFIDYLNDEIKYIKNEEEEEEKEEEVEDKDEEEMEKEDEKEENKEEKNEENKEEDEFSEIRRGRRKISDSDEDEFSEDSSDSDSNENRNRRRRKISDSD